MDAFILCNVCTYFLRSIWKVLDFLDFFFLLSYSYLGFPFSTHEKVRLVDGQSFRFATNHKFVVYKV
jgi:hypothetical protein